MDSDADTSPPPPPPASPSTRYAYLVARLRNRQITMNEATELFEMQQTTLASALARARSAPPPPPSPAAGTAAEPAAAPPPSLGTLPDDAFWMGLLAAGAGAGLLAAVLKRARDGPAGDASAGRGSAPSSGR